MRMTRVAIPAVLALALSVLPLLGQSYGEGDQVLTIGAAAFQDEVPYPPFSSIHSDGYIYFVEFGAAAFGSAYIDSDAYLCSIPEQSPLDGFEAPLDLPEDAEITQLGLDTPLELPEGAKIAQICLYAYDSASLGVVSIVLQAIKLAPGGQGPAVVDIGGSGVVSIPASAYNSQCTSPFSFTVRSTMDVDGDGVPDAVSYRVRARFDIQPTIGLGGVQIKWRRQVSPQPDVPTFGDVPVSDRGYQYIEALAASGITGGCGGGNYCPDANLTRRQMAVFLAKALGLHWAE
jgi:hypothetical protein